MASNHRPRRLVFIGLNSQSKGLGRLLEELTKHLKERFEIHFLSLGDPAPGRYQIRHITYYPEPVPSLRSALRAQSLVEELEPTHVLIAIDMIWLAGYLQALQPFRRSSQLVGYIALEGRLEDTDGAAVLSGFDTCILYTEYSVAEVREKWKQLQSRWGDKFTPPRSFSIPHGVETKDFQPLAESAEANLAPGWRGEAKRRAFPDREYLHDGFVVLNANLPYERKRLDLTLRGFAAFAKNKPHDVALCLHHPHAYSQQRAQLIQLARELGIDERIIWSPHVLGDDGVLSLNELNLLYNACDVGINTAMGEGWGLVSIEHAATGRAQIVPNHTNLAEIWAGSAELLDPVSTFSSKIPPFEMDVVSPEGVAKSLEKLYSNPEYFTDLSLKGYENAKRPRYRWESIAYQWFKVFDESPPGT